MRAIGSFVFVLALSAMSGGCAMTSRFGMPAFQFDSDPAVVVEGLRGTQTEEVWLHQARLATPPGCSVGTIKVLTASDATFTFTCFNGGATVTGL